MLCFTSTYFSHLLTGSCVRREDLVEVKKKIISHFFPGFISHLCHSPLSANGKINEAEGEIMHMDVKQPAKLGVRFNWCKCVWGGSPVPTALAVLWSEHCDKAPGVRDSKARGTAPLVTSMQQQRVKPGPVTSRQCFGDTDMPFTATAPSMMEHSSPLDLKVRKISSLAIPPGHFTDGDREVGRWGDGGGSPTVLHEPRISLFLCTQQYSYLPTLPLRTSGF